MTWSSTSFGERPGHSVKTMTWFSPTLGMASIGTTIAQYPPMAAMTMAPSSVSIGWRTQNAMSGSQHGYAASFFAGLASCCRRGFDGRFASAAGTLCTFSPQRSISLPK